MARPSPGGLALAWREPGCNMSAAAQDWSSQQGKVGLEVAAMAEAVRILREEHADMAILLDVMDRQIAQFKRGDTPDFNIVRGIINYFLSFPDLYHHPKEDLIVQKLQERAPENAAALESLFASHQDLALLTRRLATAAVDQMVRPREAPREWFSSLARAFVDANRGHMAMEEERFFPVILQDLTEEDWAEFQTRATSGTDLLFGRKIDEHFRALRDAILERERRETSKAAILADR